MNACIHASRQSTTDSIDAIRFGIDIEQMMLVIIALAERNKKPAAPRGWRGFRYGETRGGTKMWCPEPESNRHAISGTGF
jgi:hypothetical protein